MLALSLMCWGGVCSNPVSAGYVAPDSYSTVINGNGTGDKRMTVTSGALKSYHFSNIKQNPADLVGGGALNFEAGFTFDTNSITNFLFEDNYGYIGGGMKIGSQAMPVEIFNSRFISNTADSDGGALYDTTSIEIHDSIFENNRSIGGRGGALFFAPDGNDFGGMSKFLNTDFINNSSGKEGGAIYMNSSGVPLYLSVDDNQTHYMSGNIQNTDGTNGASSSNAIFINKGKIYITTSDGSKLIIDDGIEGASADKMSDANVTYRTNYGGTLVLNNEVKNLVLTHASGNLLLNHGDKLADGVPILNNVDLLIKPGDGGFNKKDLRFDLANGKLDTLLIRNLTITEPNGDQKLIIALDVDLNQGKSDFFNVSGTATGGIKLDAEHFEFNIIDGDAESFQLISGAGADFLTGGFTQYGDDFKYNFTAGENGFINVSKEDAYGLNEAVADTDPLSRIYAASHDIKLSSDLGALGGEALVVNMNGYNLNGNNVQGVSLSSAQRLEIKNAGELNNFYTTGNGSVVNNIGGAVTITDSVIANNTSDGKGGAIYALGGAVTVNADTKDVIFKNNMHQLQQPETPDVSDTTRSIAASKAAVEGIRSANDIYLENTADNKAALTVNGTKNTVFESGIAGDGEVIKNDEGILKLAGNNSDFKGDVYLNNGEIQLLSGASYFNAQNTFIKNNARVNLINNNPNDVVNFGNLNLDGNAKLGIDVDGRNKLNDKITALSVSGDGKILIDNVNIMSLPTGAGSAQFDIITLADGQDASPLLGAVELSSDAKNVMSPIFKYQADFDSNTGIMTLASGSAGNKNSYNPSILATSVALQTAAQAGIKEAVNYAFEHNDSFTKFSRNERFAKINADKYAISEFNGQLPLYYGQTEGSGFWFRPYTVFESIDLKHGPKVDNLSYGSLIGFDSKFKERRHGWTSLTSSFIGYHGSSLDYSDVDISSNGVLLGVTKNYYKRNFWTALTASGSVGIGEISEMYGDDDIVHLSGAVSSRTGYNVEFADGRFIIQPNVSLSYYISKIFDYTNEAGVKINSDPLNSFEVKPGVRVVGNTKGGWQPYISAAFVWNFFNDTDVRADGIKLPDMRMDPYVEYGLGIQKVTNNDFTCYLQSLVRNGGRTGVALTGGLSWAVGKKRGRIHL